MVMRAMSVLCGASGGAAELLFQFDVIHKLSLPETNSVRAAFPPASAFFVDIDNAAAVK
jgi:hypothetical protein